MKKNKVIKLIDTYLKGKISTEQGEKLSAFLNSYQSKDYSWKSEYGNQDEIGKRIFDKIQQKIPQQNKKSVRSLQFLKYAASVIVLLGIGLYWESQQINKFDPNSINKEEIVLRLSDGSTKIINTAENDQVKNIQGTIIGVQQEDQISYADTNKEEETEFFEHTEFENARIKEEER